LAKNLYEKLAHKTLMKLTADEDLFNIHSVDRCGK
jgi:hypothetical protein